VTTTDHRTRGAGSGLSATERLTECRDAEDYFRLLDLDFDPAVLSVNRLHILRAFGHELATLTAGHGTDAPDEAVRAALRRSYETFRDSTSLDHRLFRVLQDHTPREVIGPDSIQPDPIPEDPTTAPAPRAIDAPLPSVPTAPQGGPR
jgi:nitrogenase-stabilizing/protective protein